VKIFEWALVQTSDVESRKLGFCGAGGNKERAEMTFRTFILSRLDPRVRGFASRPTPTPVEPACPGKFHKSILTIRNFIITVSYFGKLARPPKTKTRRKELYSK